MNEHKTLLVMISVLSWCAVNCKEEKLLYSTHSYVKEIDLKSGDVKVLLFLAGSYMFSLAYDYDGRYLYIPRRSGDIIKFPYPNNQTVQFEIVVSVNAPLGIAFDSVNKHIYWTEDEKGKIMRCNADGTNKTTILDETQPSALSIDVENRWIYYSQELNNGNIYRLTFDGKNRRVIYNLSSYVYGIQVDVIDMRLYWNEFSTGDIKSVWYNGSNVQTVVSTNLRNNWGLDTNDDFIFFSSHHSIFKMAKSVGQTPTVVHIDTNQIYGVFLYKYQVNLHYVCFVEF
ncbi:low-density lipoprotein receptor-related protein 8-like isoform X2 [Mytilus edulis]|uniref:low-density lipoprotein receptor-related protein 8-like isoform X2 n=1 Tax=Mytilus edulis TaxID=6550 RepID=UPI0039F04C28